MLCQAFKLAWRRKGANALVILEMLISFLVLFGLGVGIAQTAGFYLTPLGFDWHEVWNVELTTDLSPREVPEIEGSFVRLLAELEGLEDVEAAAAAATLPYGSSALGTYIDEKGRKIYTEVIEASDHFDLVLRLDLVAGRWFDKSDDALDWEPVVLDLALAREVFGDADPLGMRLPGNEDHDQRVIGLVSRFRRGGELWRDENTLFRRSDLERAEQYLLPQLVLRVRPGAPRSLRRDVVEMVRGHLPGWSARVRPLEELRSRAFRDSTAPLAVSAVVALFLLFMVALGLTGVLWQNVIGRTREIGLRRALGASAGGIRNQVLVELVVTTTLGVSIGLALVLQLPILDLVPDQPAWVWFAGGIAALVVMYTLVLACGLYPGWLASRVHPAEALAHE